MKLVCLMLAVASLGASGAGADDAPMLLEQHKCNACHDETDAKTGPSYVDIAQQYRRDPRAAARLAAAIRNGGTHGGLWHMPPHPEISDAEAAVMIRAILSKN